MYSHMPYKILNNVIWGCPVVDSSPNSDLGGQKMSEFSISLIPNTVRVAIYHYTPKHILKVLNNPKTPHLS